MLILKKIIQFFFLIQISGLSLAQTSSSFVELWSTKPVFDQPESVVYDILRKSIYVSNVNGKPGEKAGNGYVSLVSHDGSIEKLKWLEGLNAPKGMALRGTQLFVADIDQLVVVDVEKAQVIKRFSTNTDSFLNDVAISSDGTVYVSDTINNAIYFLNKGEFSIWIKDERLEWPNGLYVDNNSVFVGSWGRADKSWKTEVPGHVLKIDINDKSILDFGGKKPIGNIDGISKKSDSSVIVSDWLSGKMSIVQDDGYSGIILNLKPGIADFILIKSISMLIIPNMNSGTLSAYTY